MTVVIDKAEHLSRYQVWRYDPYHYCLEVLIERYVLWLRRRNQTGDVMAEVRGGKHDRRLERSFTHLHKTGSSFVKQMHFERHLTSASLKMKPKSANVAGLQIADLLAHPSAGYIRHIIHTAPAPSGFAARITQILIDQKYYRSESGKIDGYGVKWLP